MSRCELIAESKVSAYIPCLVSSVITSASILRVENTVSHTLQPLNKVLSIQGFAHCKRSHKLRIRHIRRGKLDQQRGRFSSLSRFVRKEVFALEYGQQREVGGTFHFAIFSRTPITSTIPALRRATPLSSRFGLLPAAECDPTDDATQDACADNNPRQALIPEA